MNSLEHKELGFDKGENYDWNEYIKYRPLYPTSLFSRIYDYHASRASNAFETAHDVGAGHGIVSEMLSAKFPKVIVSEPNPKYLQLAQKRLQSLNPLFPNGSFEYLEEAAEQSSVKSGSVDVLTICEAIHWTDIPQAISEFARQLKSGGTLCIVYYWFGRIIDNEKAQKVWNELYLDFVDVVGQSNSILARAGASLSNGYDDIEFRENMWESGMQRFFINTGGDRDIIRVNGRMENLQRPDKVREDEKRMFVENDDDWITDNCDLEWLQKMYINFTVGRTLEDDKERWVQLEEALGGKDQKVRMAWPVLQILATRK
ncbi:S-adenosyl-L-methionine-dependent methyltransferase [Xylogone sp. PMI_703]|nr:S-adenosyl-L-methionine-dependent methyltransferase [Xylogone sp. PMI_703]